MGKGHQEDLVQGQEGQGHARHPLFLCAKYVSKICKLVTSMESSMPGELFCKAHHETQGRGSTPTNHRLWIMRSSWFYEILNQFYSLYSLQSAGPMAMSNHKKIQKMMRLRDIMLPMDLLLGNTCQAM
ncbi:hypothetical protein Y1Q_0024253 [Alligator mississippiensis]|uniref:Uncharacterized protein n=1 Tax=Alligator mississippiensis TaxID=8496 RepID=A0A151NIB2_ALLMI|nr:hypothetical protein Y1Q_0024253 [Alligator mississippiensis]